MRVPKPLLCRTAVLAPRSSRARRASGRPVGPLFLALAWGLVGALASACGDGGRGGGAVDVVRDVPDLSGDLGALDWFGGDPGPEGSGSEATSGEGLSETGTEDQASEAGADTDATGEDVAVDPDQPDPGTPDTVTPDPGGSEVQEDLAADLPEETPFVPEHWDWVVLTDTRGQLYKNGSFFAQVPNLHQGDANAQFVSVRGLATSIYTLTADGQGRVDTDSLFQVSGAAAGTRFVDLAVGLGATGAQVYTVEANGEVRLNGGHLMSVPLSGQTAASITLVGQDFYLVTTTGTVLRGNTVDPLRVPVDGAAGDQVTRLRSWNGQFYALTQKGKVFKNDVQILDLSSKADPPFVGLAVTPDHIYVVTRDCVVFEDHLPIQTVQPFTGEHCVGIAVVYAED